jgi:hypothetical protein
VKGELATIGGGGMSWQREAGITVKDALQLGGNLQRSYFWVTEPVAEIPKTLERPEALSLVGDLAETLSSICSVLLCSGVLCAFPQIPSF